MLEMRAPVLSHNELLEIRTAVISMQLGESRAALLVGLPVSFIASLPGATAPGEQILVDLDSMNTAGKLADGTVPLLTWLSNAIELAGLRAEVKILEAARRRCRTVGSVHQSVIPAPHNLPTRRIFVGRERELAQVHAALHRESQSSVVRASLWGLAGVGKTALVLEYAHRALERGEYPGGIWWVMAEGSPHAAIRRLEAVLHSCAPGTLDSVRSDTTNRMVQELRLALEAQDKPSLLVLDNVSERGFATLLPGNKVRVLMTSRDQGLALGEDIRLDVLAAADARALAMQINGLTPTEMDALDRVVVQILGGLAMAVEVAARAVKLWAGGWEHYEALLSKHLERALDRRNDRSEYYVPGVFAALDASMARCSERAHKLLEGMAVFAPEAVPLTWVCAVAELDSEDIDVQEALGELNRMGLVALDRVASTGSLHRLMRARVRERTESKTSYKMGRRAVELVASWIETMRPPSHALGAIEQRRVHIGSKPWNAIERRHVHIGGRLWGGWLAPAEMQKIELFRAHINESLVVAERNMDDAMWSRIANVLALYFGSCEDYDRARSLLERALALDGKTYGSSHAGIANSLSNLARVLMSMNAGIEARALLERELALNEQVYGLDQPEVANTLENLASVLLNAGNVAAALPLLHRVLTIDEKTYGSSAPEVARSLAEVLKAVASLGDEAMARPLLERDLAINENIYGPDHLQVARCLANLANVVGRAGDTPLGCLLLERAVAIAEKGVGKANDFTITLQRRLAWLHTRS